jgi:two-component system phosphate regulon sensor histidine kinase PhoR
MSSDTPPWPTRLAIPCLLLALASGATAAFGGDLRVVAFVVFLASMAGVFWSTQSLWRSYILQSARLARTERRVLAARSEGESAARSFTDLIEGLRVMLFVVDDKFRVIAANKAARKEFQFRDPVGESLVEVTHSHELEELAGLAAKSPTRLRQEVTIGHPTEARVRAYAWKNGAVPGQVFISLLDVTKLRRLETVRRDFVANVSHELRTPMTTIRAMSETLLDGEPEDRELTDRYLQKIIREVDRLTAMTDDLLTLSKIENERPLQQPFNLVDVARSVVQQLIPKAKKKGIDLRFVSPDRLSVLGSSSEMTQVVLNLVDNAINYTATGSVEVALVAEGERIKMTVRDTGIGIAEEHLRRIFERFYRVDRGRSRATGGTGLGLSIVRHIVESHDGSIKVESELNKGSVFTVVLPLGE